MSYSEIRGGRREINKGVVIKTEEEFIEFIEEIGFRRVNDKMEYYELRDRVYIYIQSAYIYYAASGQLVKGIGRKFGYYEIYMNSGNGFDVELDENKLGEFLNKVREEWENNIRES